VSVAGRRGKRMQLHITLYGAMRVVAGQSNVDLSFDTPSVTIAQVVEVLTAAYPRVRPYLLDASGGLQSSVRILLNNERPDPDVTLATALHANDRLVFLTPVAGGAAELARFTSSGMDAQPW
jgi:molybdopterin converting factor small subunit